MNSMAMCGAMAVLPGPLFSQGRTEKWVGLRSQFLDQGHLKFYSRPKRMQGSIRSSIGQFELKTVDDESVQDVIRQLEELQMKVRAKKKELKSKKKQIKAKKCKESSSSSSESSDDDCTTEMTSTVNRVESTVAYAKIEVCGGGKCRKNGSPQVLEAFQRRIQGENPSVVASSCKCMGMCGDGPNVRMKKSFESSVHNHVSVEDVDMLLFQLGQFPSMMPTSKAF